MRYQSNRPKRQFLSGVKCPACGTMDAVVQVQLFVPQSDEYIECTTCGHTERRPDASQVNHLQSQTLGGFTGGGTDGSHSNDDVQPVRFISATRQQKNSKTNSKK